MFCLTRKHLLDFHFHFFWGGFCKVFFFSLVSKEERNIWKEKMMGNGVVFAFVFIVLVAVGGGVFGIDCPMSRQCKVCRKMVLQAASTNGTALEDEVAQWCQTLPAAAAPFPYCASEYQVYLVSALKGGKMVDSLATCSLLGLCSGSEPEDACGGPCSSSSQCGPGCYCNGYGQCDDSCFPSCQGESQFCPSGCGCGDYGFCDAD